MLSSKEKTDLIIKTLNLYNTLSIQDAFDIMKVVSRLILSTHEVNITNENLLDEIISMKEK